MEGRIEKHTLSCGQDIEREKHTHNSTKFFKKRECRGSGMHTEKKKHTAVMLCALRFQGARSMLIIVTRILKKNTTGFLFSSFSVLHSGRHAKKNSR